MINQLNSVNSVALNTIKEVHFMHCIQLFVEVIYHKVK